VTGLVLLLTALGASVLGADRARVPVESKELAKRTLLRAIENGPEDPEVRAAMVRLRTEIGRRPLAARTRSIYAVMLLGVSRGPDDLAAPLFHAARAAASAPVTVPVVRDAANVLVRGGRPSDGLRLTREMFGYDPDAAARLLGELEPFLSAEETSAAIPDVPTSWLARFRALRGADRKSEADALIEQAFRRWPGDGEVRLLYATLAHDRADWGSVFRALPPSEPIPEGRDASRLQAYRARARLERGDVEGALGDVAAALASGASDVRTLMAAAAVQEHAETPEAARDSLNRALFLLGATGRTTERLAILVRLARLEQRRGEASSALRAWRSVLELAPDHAEARRRVDELTGFRR
jgi:Flp pilus assembly protein TadD